MTQNATAPKLNMAAEIGRQIGFARTAASHGDTENARHHAEAALANLKNVELNYENLDWRQLAEGDAQWLLGNTAAAEKAYRQAMVAAPSQNGGYQRLAELLQTLGRMEDFAKHLELCAKRFPKDPLFLKMLAVHEAANQNYDAAIPALSRAYSANPNDAETADALGICLQNINQFNEAVLYHNRAVELEPDNAAYVLRFGLAMAGTEGGGEAAMELYRMAIHINPSLYDAYAFLAREMQRMGQTESARTIYQEALVRDPGNALVNFYYGQFLQEAGQGQEAIAHYDKTIGAPDAPAAEIKSARFLRAAALGETPERPPEEFVKIMFNYFAPGFEAAITSNPQYRSPGMLQELLCRPEVTAVRDIKTQSPRVLDLGCGTGLMGMVMKPYAAALMGVDLSQSMLQRANEKEIYAVTRCMDIAAYVRDEMPKGGFDLITAADVLIYLGQLDGIFAGLAEKSEPKTLFAFGCEKLPEETPGPGYALRSTVRYAHKDSYIRALAAQNGFDVLAHADAPLSQCADKTVDGLFYVLAKK